MKYAKLLSSTSVSFAVPKSAIIDGTMVIGTLPKDYLASIGFFPYVDTPMPEPEEGYHYERSYKKEKDSIVVVWTKVENPPAPPRVFSKMKCVAALMKEGVWEVVKNYITEAGLYDLYLAAQNFSEDNEYFVEGKKKIQSALEWTDEHVEAVLSECVLY